jgi:uncharacterized membrane protein
MADAENSTRTMTVEKSRLEFLFDGVFAIAMTILVLDLRVPDVSHGDSVVVLGRALRNHAATFGSYLLSFFMLGILWYRHNQLCRHLQWITAPVFGLHLIQLAAAATFPFCAALLGKHLTNPLALVTYSGCIMVYQWAGLWILQAARTTSSLGASGTQWTHDWRRQRRSVLMVTTLFAGVLAWAVLVAM